MADTEQISLRLSKKLLNLLNDMAKEEMRTRTNLIEYILVKWLKENAPQAFDDDGEIME